MHVSETIFFSARFDSLKGAVSTKTNTLLFKRIAPPLNPQTRYAVMSGQAPGDIVQCVFFSFFFSFDIQ